MPTPKEISDELENILIELRHLMATVVKDNRFSPYQDNISMIHNMVNNLLVRVK